MAKRNHLHNKASAEAGLIGSVRRVTDGGLLIAGQTAVKGGGIGREASQRMAVAVLARGRFEHVEGKRRPAYAAKFISLKREPGSDTQPPRPGLTLAALVGLGTDAIQLISINRGPEAFEDRSPGGILRKLVDENPPSTSNDPTVGVELFTFLGIPRGIASRPSLHIEAQGKRRRELHADSDYDDYLPKPEPGSGSGLAFAPPDQQTEISSVYVAIPGATAEAIAKALRDMAAELGHIGLSSAAVVADPLTGRVDGRFANYHSSFGGDARAASVAW